MSNISSCYFPDGSLASSGNFVPCDPSATNSACCVLGETCVGNNLCLSVNGLMYRGGCTDSTFKSSACPAVCVGETGNNIGKQDAFTFLKPCDASSGQLQWVCDLDSDCSNSSLRFDLHVGSVREVNITGTIATSSSSSTSPTTSPRSTSTLASITSSKDQCKKGTPATAVGVGVAVPLGILLLLALVWGFYERKRGRINRGEGHGAVAVQPQQYQQDHKAVAPEAGMGGAVRQELLPYHRPNELAG